MLTKEANRQGSQTQKRDSLQNHILAGLPKREYSKISPLLKPVSLSAGQVLHDVGGRATHGYFVNCGLVSTVAVMRNGDSVEVGIIGNEGFTGLPILLNISNASSRMIVQIEGSALKVESNALRNLVATVPMLEHKLSRFSYLQAIHMMQIAACNRLHDIEERLARWLLMTQDRVHSDALALTHDLLGQMLGSRRASVTIAAGILQRAGIIEYRRGKIHILDRQKLEETVCECYDVVREQLKMYLAIEPPPT